MKPQTTHRSNGTHTEENGQGLVEYSLILALVAVVVIVILAVLGPVIGNVFSGVMSAFGEEDTTEPLAAACYGDSVAPIEYYQFAEGQRVIDAPATYYTSDDCTGPSNTTNTEIIRFEVSQADANQICADNGKTQANLQGEIYWCS
jgi:pilus assembly protein Flp/PilA